jgi:uncharacterized membrane protein YadS
VSAVVALAGSIKPDRQQTAYAIATVLLFDAVTLVVYPAVGHVLDLSDAVFGIWTGLTMFSTGPVTAVGFAYSETAGEWAVLVKLTRNALIGVVAIGYAAYYNREATSRDGLAGTWSRFWGDFPKFIVGFVCLMVLGSSGFLSGSQVASLDDASGWLFLFAFSGLGLCIDVGELRETGIAPVALVAATLIAISSATLLVLLSLF